MSSCDAPNPKYANRHQILRNLKWFVKQFCSMFEETLQSKLYKAKLIPTVTGPLVDHKLLVAGYPVGSPSKHHMNVSVAAASLQKPNWCRSLTNSPIMRRLTPNRSSRGSTPIKKCAVPLRNLKCDDLQSSRLLLICSHTSEGERADQVRQFAQHVAVIYEYQIGMLKGVGAVMEVVKFVAELIVKAIKMNFITELNSRQLNPTIFFLNIPLPKSGSKIVKTLQLGPGTEFSWRVCDIFCRSGLRHNRVGGQDCSNLTISTHFYSVSGSTAYSYRPDIYGYRNIIAIENTEYQVSSSSSTTTTESGNQALVASPGTQGQEGSPGTQVDDVIRLYQLSKLDIDTLDRPSSTSDAGGGGLLGRDLAEQCMDHWHKCYKSMFFLISDRWEIVDHLENCDSFRVFCARERICPIMQISLVPTDSFRYQTINSLIQNFDIFSISSDSPLIQDDHNRPGKVFRSATNGKNQEYTSCDESPMPTKVYDNPAFVC